MRKSSRLDPLSLFFLSLLDNSISARWLHFGRRGVQQLVLQAILTMEPMQVDPPAANAAPMTLEGTNTLEPLFLVY